MTDLNANLKNNFIINFDPTYNLSFTNENNIRYVKGSWGQDGTLLGNGGLVQDKNTRCILLMSNTISHSCDLIRGSSTANRIRIYGMKTQKSTIKKIF